MRVTQRPQHRVLDEIVRVCSVAMPTADDFPQKRQFLLDLARKINLVRLTELGFHCRLSRSGSNHRLFPAGIVADINWREPFIDVGGEYEGRCKPGKNK